MTEERSCRAHNIFLRFAPIVSGVFSDGIEDVLFCTAHRTAIILKGRKQRLHEFLVLIFRDVWHPSLRMRSNAARYRLSASSTTAESQILPSAWSNSEIFRSCSWMSAIVLRKSSLEIIVFPLPYKKRAPPMTGEALHISSDNISARFCHCRHP